MRAYEQLYALAQAMRPYDGMAATLRDNRLEVVRVQPDGRRRETITCVPRPDDGGKLWFWDSQRRPVAEADKIADAALRITAHLNEGEHV